MYRCPECDRQYDEMVSFCADCGAKIEVCEACSECGAPLKSGDTVCGECGCPVGAAPLCCYECGAPLSGEEKVCGNCGAPVEDAAAPQMNKFCAECGAAIPEGVAVCKNCGAPVETAAPAVAVGAVAAPSTAQNSRPAFTIGNIIFLLTLIPSTVILLGDMFVLKASGVMEENFGYFGFSKTFNYLTDLIDLMEGFGVDSLDTVRTLTGVLGFTWTVVVIALIGVVIEFFGGIAQANKGKLLDKLCFMPLTYLVVSVLFCVLTNVVLIFPINDVLESGIVGKINDFIGFKLSVDMGAPALWLACIGLVNVVVYIVLKLVEKLNSRTK